MKPDKSELNLRLLFSKMVENIYLDQPEDIALYMLNYLKKDQGITSSGLSKDESTELDKLRFQQVRYKQLDEYTKQPEPRDDDCCTDDDSDEYDEALSDPKEIERRMAVTPRVPIKLESSEEKDGESEKTESQNARNEKEPKKESKQKRQREKTEEEKAADRVREDIRLRLSRLFMFEGFDEDDFNNVIAAMTQRKVNEGLNIIKQDEQNETLFYVAEGLIECYRQPAKDKKPLLIKELIKGDIVGELGLLRKNGFIATLTVVKEAVVYCLSRKDFVAARKQSIEKRMKVKESLIRKVKLFEDLEQKDFSKLATLFKEGVYTQGETIYKSGQYGEVLYIIEKGECIALRADEPGKLETEGEVFKYGSVFGENALLLGAVREETLIAKSEFVKVIGLDRDSVKGAYGSVETLLKKKHDEVMEMKKKEEEENIKKEEEILREIQRKERERLARIEEEKYVAVGEKVDKKQVRKRMKDDEMGFDDSYDEGTNKIYNEDNEENNHNNEDDKLDSQQNNNGRAKSVDHSKSEHFDTKSKHSDKKNIGEELSQHDIDDHIKNINGEQPVATGIEVGESQFNKENDASFEKEQNIKAESIHESNQENDHNEDENINNNNNDNEAEGEAEDEAEFVQEEEEVVQNIDNEDFEHHNSQRSNNNEDFEQ